jgi:predicted GIY-YIG superfamily endonuclease
MKKKCWVIYILRCSDNSLYTGISKDISKRLLAHNSGKASRYTRYRRPVHIVYIQQNMSHSAALKREYQIKAMNKKQKENLIIKNS